MQYDLIVDLHQVDYSNKECGATIKRALSPDSDLIVDFIKETFAAGWASEAKAALYKTNPTCFVAVIDKQVVGFACYDATAKAFFGPTGVHPDHQGKGIGRALLIYTLEAMYHDGYAYAVIGAVRGALGFYEKAVNAVKIENSTKHYNRLVRR